VPATSSTARNIDTISVIGILIIAAAWFGMDTLSVSFAGFSQGTRFFQMLAITRHPVLLFTGVGSGHNLEIMAFALLCIVSLLAVLAPRFYHGRHVWLATLSPLVLMLLCFALLYSGSPGWDVPPSSSEHALRADLMHFANDVMQRAQNQVASHVGLGAGGIMALLASLALAVHGTRKWLSLRSARVQQVEAA